MPGDEVAIEQEVKSTHYAGQTVCRRHAPSSETSGCTQSLLPRCALDLLGTTGAFWPTLWLPVALVICSRVRSFVPFVKPGAAHAQAVLFMACRGNISVLWLAHPNYALYTVGPVSI
jgi:hypothetical protein